MTEPLDELELLRLFVELHKQPHPHTGHRESIMYLPHLGGAHVQHHALAEVPTGINEALLEEMHAKGSDRWPDVKTGTPVWRRHVRF